jgi:MFS family permease
MYVEAMMIPALPQIFSELNYSVNMVIISWIITIYLLVATISMPVFGKLGEIYGKKKMLMLALLIYSFSVSLSGFTNQFYILIFLRGVQGIGAAVFPLSYAILADYYNKEMLPLTQGVLSAMFALGASVGIIVGSDIVQNLNWQWSYHTIAPFVIISLILVFKEIKKDTPEKKEKFDFLSITFLTLSMIYFVVAMGFLPAVGIYNFTVISLLILSVASFIMFIIYALVQSHPLIEINILSNRNVFASNVIAIFLGIIQFILYQPLIFLLIDPVPVGYSFSYFYAGLIIAPYSIAMLFAAPLSAILIKRIGQKKVLVYGSILSMFGYISLAATMGVLPFLIISISIISCGLSFGLVGSINLLTISLPSERVSSGTSFNILFRTMGGVMGGTIAALLLIYWQYQYIPNIYAAPILLPAWISYKYIFLTGALFSLLSLIASFMVKVSSI